MAHLPRQAAASPDARLERLCERRVIVDRLIRDLKRYVVLLDDLRKPVHSLAHRKANLHRIAS